MSKSTIFIDLLVIEKKVRLKNNFADIVYNPLVVKEF